MEVRGEYVSLDLNLHSLNPKVIKRAALAVLTSVDSVAAKRKEEKDKRKGQVRF